MLTGDDFRAAAELAATYLRGVSERPITPQQPVRFPQEPLPESPTALPDLLHWFEHSLVPTARQNAHPRMFGYITSAGDDVAVVGALLAAALNANLTAWRSAPGPTEIEHQVVGWFKAILGFPEQGTGLLTSGGSMANLAALAAARAKLGPAMRVHASEDTHFSVLKAARLLGIEAVPLDAPLSAPPCIVATAGTTSTGHIEPIADLLAQARRYDGWLHVDAAYGGFAALVPEVRERFRGIEEADSITLDPHKWLRGQMGCGCVLYRDPAAARAAFSHDAEYTRTLGLENREAFAFWDYGPELSRPFRALPIWMQIKAHGLAALRASVEQDLDNARYFASLVEQADDFELLCPVELSIFCFRWRPRHYAGDLGALNERLLIALNRAGSSYLSNARVNGCFALRGCVLNPRTTRADMERLFNDVRTAGDSVLREAHLATQ